MPQQEAEQGFHVTAAGVKISAQQFNMEDYTTKLDKSTLSREQIEFADRIAKEIEREQVGDLFS